MTGLTLDLSHLPAGALTTFAAQTGLGAHRLEHPFVAAAFANLARAAEDEERRRVALRPAFPHHVTLPLDPDADPLSADLALDALLDIAIRLRDRPEARGGPLSGVWGEICAQLGELRSERRRGGGEVVDLLTRPSRV